MSKEELTKMIKKENNILTIVKTSLTFMDTLKKDHLDLTLTREKDKCSRQIQQINYISNERQRQIRMIKRQKVEQQKQYFRGRHNLHSLGT